MRRSGESLEKLKKHPRGAEPIPRCLRASHMFWCNSLVLCKTYKTTSETQTRYAWGNQSSTTFKMFSNTFGQIAKAFPGRVICPDMFKFKALLSFLGLPLEIPRIPSVAWLAQGVASRIRADSETFSQKPNTTRKPRC